MSISREKFRKEEKLCILQWVEQGHTIKAAVRKFGVSKETIRIWRWKLKAQGSSALTEMPGQQSYPEELKLSAVKAYLAGEGSQSELAIKYGLRSKTQLQRWILKYTRGEAMKSSRGGSDHTMTKGRKTSFEERLEIVRYCETHGNNFQGTAEVYQVSYSQVYTWMKKYEQGGEKALLDRRGKAKDELAPTELDRLKLENRKLQRQNRELEVENALLKKLEELERRSK